MCIRDRNQVEAPVVEAGDIVAIAKLQFTKTGDTLCEKANIVKFPPVKFPAPALYIAIEPKDKGDDEKVGTGLHKLMEEDPSFVLERNVETHQSLLGGQGEIQLSICLLYTSGIVTADSMRGRGYGSGRRTNFSVYRFELRDRIMLSCMAVLMAVTACCCIAGAAEVAYTPELYIKPAGDPVSVAGLISYGIFLMIPAGVNITEEIKWRILRSKI